MNNNYGHKNSSNPYVSIITPVYNGELYIEAAVKSVINQSYQNWELLVIDDGSTDSTCEIVQRLAAEDARIVLIQNSENMGVAKTRNKGFELSCGDYIALLDGDDVWRQDKLEKQLILADETKADIVYCSYGMIDAHDQKLCDDFIVPSTTDYHKTLTRSVISCSTALLSREIVDRYRFKNEYYHEDLIFWLEILRDGYKAWGAAEVLADYRILHGSRASNKIKSAVQRWKVYRGYFKEPFFTSVKYIVKYARMALKKYKRI